MNDYTVVAERDLDEFRKKVNDLIEKGYRLIGGVSICVANGREQYVIYAQALAWPT